MCADDGGRLTMQHCQCCGPFQKQTGAACLFGASPVAGKSAPVRSLESNTYDSPAVLQVDVQLQVSEAHVAGRIGWAGGV